jgi:hypothetical protein
MNQTKTASSTATAPGHVVSGTHRGGVHRQQRPRRVRGVQRGPFAKAQGKLTSCPTPASAATARDSDRVAQAAPLSPSAVRRVLPTCASEPGAHLSGVSARVCQ